MLKSTLSSYYEQTISKLVREEETHGNEREINVTLLLQVLFYSGEYRQIRKWEN